MHGNSQRQVIEVAQKHGMRDSQAESLLEIAANGSQGDSVSGFRMQGNNPPGDSMQTSKRATMPLGPDKNNILRGSDFSGPTDGLNETQQTNLQMQPRQQ